LSTHAFAASPPCFSASSSAFTSACACSADRPVAAYAAPTAFIIASNDPNCCSKDFSTLRPSSSCCETLNSLKRPPIATVALGMGPPERPARIKSVKDGFGGMGRKGAHRPEGTADRAAGFTESAQRALEHSDGGCRLEKLQPSTLKHVRQLAKGRDRDG